MLTTASKALGLGLPMPFRACVVPPVCLDPRHMAIRFNVCSEAFQSCFVHLFLCVPQFFPFVWNCVACVIGTIFVVCFSLDMGSSLLARLGLN